MASFAADNQPKGVKKPCITPLAQIWAEPPWVHRQLPEKAMPCYTTRARFASVFLFDGVLQAEPTSGTLEGEPFNFAYSSIFSAFAMGDCRSNLVMRRFSNANLRIPLPNCGKKNEFITLRVSEPVPDTCQHCVSRIFIGCPPGAGDSLRRNPDGTDGRPFRLGAWMKTTRGAWPAG